MVAKQHRPHLLERPHRELRRLPPKAKPAMNRIQQLAANLPRPTPLQRAVGKAMDQANYLKTRQALIARDSRGYDALRNPGARGKTLDDIQGQILQTLGEASGSRLPIERGLY